MVKHCPDANQLLKRIPAGPDGDCQVYSTVVLPLVSSIVLLLKTRGQPSMYAVNNPQRWMQFIVHTFDARAFQVQRDLPVMLLVKVAELISVLATRYPEQKILLKELTSQLLGLEHRVRPRSRSRHSSSGGTRHGGRAKAGSPHEWRLLMDECRAPGQVYSRLTASERLPPGLGSSSSPLPWHRDSGV